MSPRKERDRRARRPEPSAAGGSLGSEGGPPLRADVIGLLETLDAAVVVLGRGLYLRGLTPSAGRLTGWTGADVGKSFGDLRPAFASPELPRWLSDAADSGLPSERIVRHRDGQTCSVRIRPLRTRSQTIDGVVLLLASVPPRGDESARHLVGTAPVSVGDEFLSAVSHELRGPLGAIGGWVHVLSSGKADPSVQAQALSAIERGVQTEARLIDDLVDFTRMLTGTVSLSSRPLDLVPVIEAVLSKARPAAEARGVHLEPSRGVATALVLGDLDRLLQVVSNLVSNAVAFTPGGGRVTVSVGRGDRSWELTVADTGEGIHPSLLPHVFDRFGSAPGGPSAKRRGLRLGLVIVRRLVELHGGEVQAASDGEGRGATFVVRLPIPGLEISPETSTEVVEGPGSETRRPEPGPSAMALRGLRILLVEDEADTREALTAVLEQHGASVVASASAQEAVGLVAAASPDVIVSDIGLPVEDGYSLIRRIRALSADRGGTVVALALSAYARPEDKDRALAAGFQAHIAKPADPDDLVRQLQILAGRA